jgi:NADH-quinone oxidoreductase subunit L
LIPAAPFAASLIILSLSKARRKSAVALALIGEVIALALSILAFVSTLQDTGFRAVQNFDWFTFGQQTLRLGFLLDPLTAAMLVMIALVGLCIFIFSVGYMAEDKNFTRFFAYLSFFSGAMLSLVIANSLLLLFIFGSLSVWPRICSSGSGSRNRAAAAAKEGIYHHAHWRHGIFPGMLWLLWRGGTASSFLRWGNGCLGKCRSG